MSRVWQVLHGHQFFIAMDRHSYRFVFRSPESVVFVGAANISMFIFRIRAIVAAVVVVVVVVVEHSSSIRCDEMPEGDERIQRDPTRFAISSVFKINS